MGLKELVQKSIHDKHLKIYNQELERQSDSYQAYIDVVEKEDMKKCITVRDAAALSESVTVLQFNELGDDPSVLDGSCPFILFINGDGLLPEKLCRIIENKFDDDPELNVIYFDEDELDKDSGRRMNPWFKASWSPDSFFSSFYFGNIVAVRKSAIDELDYIGSNIGLENLYSVVLNICLRYEPAHIDMVMFHRYIKENENLESYTGGEAIFDDIKLFAYRKLGVNVKFVEDKYGFSHAAIDAGKPKISIIIPTKDHPEILRRCLISIRDISSYKNYEIVVVDNGSELDSRLLYERMANEFNYKYIYKEMPFNFSKMCNMGASESTGSLLLFLNDDTELKTANALEIMAGQLALSHVGAVGAKLYYPSGDLIQHVGITNMTEGPSHKLLAESDSNSIYHGVNRFDRDVIGVTAACLMVTREKYDMVSGFPEKLSVAYNDVYFCFALYMKGCYNVIRNDVIFIHHESLSRGDDHKDSAKMERLKNERITLFKDFPMLYGNDPFYSLSLTGAGNEYECILPFENRNIRPVNDLQLVKFPDIAINETLIINVDRAENEPISKDEKCVIVDLHAHVRGLDSCDYEYSLLLKNGEMTFNVPVIRRIRPDVIKTFPDEIHVELSGFVARIPVRFLEAGSYEIYMMAKSIFSRQILLNKASVTLDLMKE